jgi:ribonuclease D
MDGMLKCGDVGESPVWQCKLFRVSTNPVDEKADLEKINEFIGKSRVLDMKSQYVTSKTDYWHIFVVYDSRDEMQALPKTEKSMQAADIDEAQLQNEVDTALVEKLKAWRHAESINRGWPAYRVLTNSVIDELSRLMPSATEQLNSIRGIGRFTADNFGTDIINIITRHRKEQTK